MAELTLIKGDDKTFTLNFKDSSDVAIDITGYTVFFTVKVKKTDSDANAIIKKDITTHSDPTNGQTQLVLTSSDTTKNAAIYYYDIQLKTDTDEIKTVSIGTLNIQQDVTIRST
jgi:hypothetical protein